MATTRPTGSHETRGGRIEEAVGHGGGRARVYGVRDVGRRRGGRPEKKAATKVTLQLKWVTQAQFAGYYAALEKGFYDKAGLDVTIKVGGPSITPEHGRRGQSARSSASTGCRTSSPRARRARSSSPSPRSSRGRG